MKRKKKDIQKMKRLEHATKLARGQRKVKLHEKMIKGDV